MNQSLLEANLLHFEPKLSLLSPCVFVSQVKSVYVEKRGVLESKPLRHVTEREVKARKSLALHYGTAVD